MLQPDQAQLRLLTAEEHRRLRGRLVSEALADHQREMADSSGLSVEDLALVATNIACLEIVGAAAIEISEFDIVRLQWSYVAYFTNLRQVALSGASE